MFVAICGAALPVGAQITGYHSVPGLPSSESYPLSGQIRTDHQPLPAGLTVRLRRTDAGLPLGGPLGVDVGADGDFKINLPDDALGAYEVLVYRSDQRLLHREHVFVNMTVPLVIWLPEDTGPKAPNSVVSWTQLFDPPSSQVKKLYQKALKAKRKGRSRPSIELLQRAVSLHPSYAEAHYELGLCWLELGDPAQAAAAFQRAAEINPAWDRAQSNLGIALQGSGRVLEAEAAFRRAVRLRPASSLNRFNLGLVLFQQGKLTDEATALFQAARPELPRASLYIAYIEEQRGQRSKAVETLRNYLATKDDFRRKETRDWLANLEASMAE
ncbi:MAG TPA: tetratricopeptide repeat protein [Bryobacterales bacterium]|nr:tetratricopeptide repeat protein [Bryobacterales bacterium]